MLYRCIDTHSSQRASYVCCFLEINIRVQTSSYFSYKNKKWQGLLLQSLMAKHVSNYEKLSLDLILYGEAGHVSWLLRNTLKYNAKLVMFALEGKTSDSHCGKL